MSSKQPENRPNPIAALVFGLFLVLLLSACASPNPTQGLVRVTIQADGKQAEINAPAGSTVQAALESASITLGSLDRVDPPTFTLITSQLNVKVVRVQELFDVEETTIAFTRQTVKNESLPEGQQLLVQPGSNGTQQVTYRRVLEDGAEISRSAVKSVILTEPKPEILMVGVQAPFTAVPVTRTLAYLDGGNAWIMQHSSGERKPVVTTGDLDGRIFSLSPDGKWLLFTRKSTQPPSQEINSLWVIDTTQESARPIDLKVRNVVHFADWVPGVPTTVYASTVEPRTASPGWQANNDLVSLTFSATGGYVRQQELLPANSGGIYGWWGANFFISKDGKQVAYSRPDGIGLVNLETKSTVSLIDLLPYQARGDWAWVPGAAWSPDQKILYLVSHTPQPGLVAEESSPIFDLTAYVPETNLTITLGPQSGMFAYPAASAMLPGKRFMVAYLQAIFPDKSDSSRYRLVAIERDGSNKRILFPPEGAAGLEPQQVIWSPLPEDNKVVLAVIYQGNLWLINPTGGESRQITGDGLISRVDWK